MSCVEIRQVWRGVLELSTQDLCVQAFCDKEIVMSTANWGRAINVQGKAYQKPNEWGQFNIVFVGHDGRSHSKLLEFASQNDNHLYKIHVYDGSHGGVGSVLFIGGYNDGGKHICVGYYNSTTKLSSIIPDLGFCDYGDQLWLGSLFISTENTDVCVPCVLTSQRAGQKVPGGSTFKLDVRNKSNVFCTDLVHHSNLQSDVLRITTLGFQGKKESYVGYSKFVNTLTKANWVVVVRGEGKRRNSGWLVYGMYQSEGDSALFCSHCSDLESFFNSSTSIA